MTMFRKLINTIILLFGGYVDGYNRAGYDRAGYDRQGYNRRGFNKKRKHRDTGTWFDPYGYNSDGFDENGEHMDYAHLKGRRCETLDEGIVQVDLHGMSVRAAVNYLEELLDSGLPLDTYRLVIIHGYNSGQRLKSLVRGLDHPRIGYIETDIYNEGMTIYELRKWQKYH